MREVSTVCISCFGLLQSGFCENQEFINQIEQQVKTENYQYESFGCALSIPVSGLLRDHAVWISLRELFPSMYYGTHKEESFLFCKDIWKMVNSKELIECLGKMDEKYEKKSPFKVCINFTHPNSEKECGFLLDKFPDMFKKRKSKNPCETFTRTSVTEALNRLSTETFKRCYSSPPRVLDSPCVCESIGCSMEAIFIAGR